jgi:hypothetical protein
VPLRARVRRDVFVLAHRDRGSAQPASCDRMAAITAR